MTGETRTDDASMDGLARVRALLAAGGKPPIGETLGFALVEVELGRAVFEGVPGRHAYNPLGVVHGGYAATLLDSACGIATASRLAAGESFTTLELKVAYHKAMTEHTGPVRAEAIIKSMGRRVAYADATLTDDEGRLLASATSTLLVMAA
ncbi:PaaI family thioesterase [Sphingorhabdus pulchriflava]|uniref:PaaI family thioesterase n=1 Tax=Sphingorhabdus pulchriflava TaxID=2292257 RepID=A0A371B1N9_9SPHN|nr:PaaI family thioesterase [Sphingorhabdus pulchriflava]RDV01437.1 PaaI family thioesterase [Sphingorhabdus pulchriflava]